MLAATINCDMGESFGAYTIGNDEGVMPFLDICNAACGQHGGDWDVMAATVQLAQAHGVKVGAHPSLPDRQGFGRQELHMPPESFFNCLLMQVAALDGFLKLNGIKMNHIKPHGSAYLMSARSMDMARGSARVAKLYGLPLLGLAGSMHEAACVELGVEMIAEWYADLEYRDDASLIGITRGEKRTPLTHDGVYNRVSNLLKTRTWLAASGATLALLSTLSQISICVHGDQPGSEVVAKAVRMAIDDARKLA